MEGVCYLQYVETLRAVRYVNSMKVTVGFCYIRAGDFTVVG